jgi:hypothetical protein
MDKEKLNWKILAYLKNATEETVEKIKQADDRETLIDEVLNLRSKKRAELVAKHILDSQAKDEE